MYIETNEKLLGLSFHHCHQTNEHLEEITRFSILRDQILDQIASKNNDQGIIKKMLGMGTITLPCVYPSNRLPEMYQIHKDGSFDVLHNKLLTYPNMTRRN